MKHFQKFKFIFRFEKLTQNMKLKTFIFFQFIYFLVFTQIDANLVDSRDGKSYRTKSIGTQKWMAEI